MANIPLARTSWPTCWESKDRDQLQVELLKGKGGWGLFSDTGGLGSPPGTPPGAQGGEEFSTPWS